MVSYRGVNVHCILKTLSERWFMCIAIHYLAWKYSHHAEKPHQSEAIIFSKAHYYIFGSYCSLGPILGYVCPNMISLSWASFCVREVDPRLECDAISFPDTFLCLKTHCTVALTLLTLYSNFLWDALSLKWLMLIFRTTGLIIQDCFTTIKQIKHLLEITDLHEHSIPL